MTRSRRGGTSNARIEANRHAAERANIPTVELEKFAEEEERQPAKLLYPRDPSLDPQLVWRAKDEQDATDLEVPAVPIYIQETVEPQAIVEDLRRQSTGRQTTELTLFGDGFEELEFEERVDFYRHPGKWSNRLILGDSLLVMASIAEKEGLRGQVQMVFMDPPYGIEFGSNWQVSTRRKDVRDGKREDATRQPEQVRAFRDTWALGIHSYLAYLRDRMVVARSLIADSGSIFVQIGDTNVHLVRNLLDEVFGAENFVALIPFRKKTMPLGTNFIEQMDDFLLWYAKDRTHCKYRKLFRKLKQDLQAGYDWCQLPDGSRLKVLDAQSEQGDLPQSARVFTSKSLEPSGPMDSGRYRPTFDGAVYDYPRNGYGVTEVGMRRLIAANRVVPSGRLLRYVLFAEDKPVADLTAPWNDTVGPSGKTYVVQTANEIVKRCMLMSTDPGDLVLDPTCGSGTTAWVAEAFGRRWITIDTSRVALALARTRLMAARYPYYLLVDSKQGAEKESHLMGGIAPGETVFSGDVKKGFVYERVPHITVGAIANNPDIKEGMTREEIDAAIARHADTEILYDRPYEDKKVVRVAGPFTVESLSPHRVNIDGPEDEPATSLALGVDSARFVERIVEELRAAGVQNTYKGEKLVFDTLEPFAGVCVQATGTYREDGKSMTAAVALGPEYGTVGKELVREAAKEAAEFADILIVCGFAFEALVTDESKVGKLRILKAKMNPDLQMPDLLKKTGAGNLFMVFGEPDIEVVRGGDDTVIVAIHGLDVYDPTTGEVRSGGTDDIACWFIDTDYNGEAFFVRHAYFLGADDPYDKLKRALKADIDEEAWASLYSTTSRPFPKPTTGKIAIKVINHYGDEILKVYGVNNG